MNDLLKLLAAAVVVMSVCPPAMADWDPGDDHKMLAPQMPDPNGWDVNATLWGVGARLTLADDWLCTQGGPVQEVHFWFSAREDQAPVTLDHLYLTVFENVPADHSDTGYSTPGDTLWSRSFGPDEIAVRTYGGGEQGWYDPINNPPLILPNDHQTTYQASITEITDPFLQEAGGVYWLGLSISNQGPEERAELGWKTSVDHWQGAAVVDFGPVIPSDPILWRALQDPITTAPLDLAFVIVPEPSTITMLLGVAVAGLWLRIRRNTHR